MDISDRSISKARAPTASAAVTFPSAPAHVDTVNGLLPELDKGHMRRHLEKFTSFYTRYYKSSTGAEAAAWLLQTVNHTLANSAAAKVAHVKRFEHPWGQPSLVATIPGRSNKTVVVGAHLDSINMFFPAMLPAPGADDDGSGTVTILEALRALLSDPASPLANGSAPNTLEFHWYSAEEGGLLGSQAVFGAYAAAGRDVRAMLQQDMTGYVQGTLDAGKPPRVGVITDYVDEKLTAFVKTVVDRYCDIPYVETKCGYACSDHASARKAGYPGAFVIEGEFADSSHKIHTTEDKIESLSFDHMLQHARMTLAFAYELAMADL